MRLDKRGRRIGRNWWRELIVSTWRDATDAWWATMEATTSLYAAEMAEYREHTPPPRLADFMVGMSQKELT